MGHGSHYHRRPGSLGTMRPMRVIPGKKLPGHMGGLTVTIQNLEVVAVIKEENVILVKGNVPGANKSLVFIKTSVKHPGVVNAAEELVSYETVVDEVVEEAVEENVEATEAVEEVAETAEETTEAKEEVAEETTETSENE